MKQIISNRLNMKVLIISGLFAIIGYANAQNIQYTGIKANEINEFSKVWGISLDDAKKYDAFMRLKGKYRYPQSDPLFVLSIIADTPEDKQYFAEKAAKHENEMVKREITAAWLMTKAGEKLKLTESMVLFTNQLTGINTVAINSGKENQNWASGDRVVIKISKKCGIENCLKSFSAKAKEVPEEISKTIIFVNSRPITDLDKELFKGIANVRYQPFDRYEFPFLKESDNKAVHVRKNEVIREL